MLEGLAAWVLNNYLGKYVENLNTDQLSIALLSGKVEFENLPLRKDALRHLGLPVQIKAGFIGKVILQIPVRQIRSAPWVIVIEQLYLVANPLPVYEWDATSEELARQELKLSALDTLEAKWRLELDAKDSNSTYYSSSYSSWLNFGTGLVSDIIENIQLKIQDVHLRYEDEASISNSPFAFGITIEALSAQSCDATWAPGFSHWANGTESFKLLEMQKFAIYWISLVDQPMLSKLTLGEIAVAMSPSQTVKSTKNYLLPGVSAQAHLKRNRSEQPLRCIDTPRLVCDLLLEEVPLTLVDWQYNQMVLCMRGLDDIARLRSYRRFQPRCSVHEDPKAWWLYAISCFYTGDRQPAICRPKPTWDTCLERAKENVKYVEIYKKVLVSPTLTLSPDEKKIKDNVEWLREYDELKVLRELAMQSVNLPNRNIQNGGSNSGRSMLESWFPTWMGWYRSGSVDVAQTSPEASQLEGEILQVLSDSVENNTILKRDAVFGKFNFCLKRGCLNLCIIDKNNETSPMLELEFKNLSLNIISKPRTSSHLFELSLDSLQLKDKITLNTMFPVLVGPPGHDRATNVNRSRSKLYSSATKAEETEHLFYLAYERKPSNSGCDYRLNVRSKCLDVVYQPNAVKWLTEFLCLPHQRNITKSKIEAMKTRTKKELIKNWEHILDGRVVTRTCWDLNLDISAPQIIFVEKFTDQTSAMAVIDFGRLQLRNNKYKLKTESSHPRDEFIVKDSEEDEMFLTPCSTPPQSEESEVSDLVAELSPVENLPMDSSGLNEANIFQKLYDSYQLELADMQILIGKVKDNWRYAHNKGTSTLHVLDRFNISLQIERRIVHTSDPHYPSLTLSANLPKLVAHLNESKIMAARNLANIISATGLPSPFKTPDDPLGGQDLFDEEDSASFDTSIELSRMFIMQFTADNVSLEVQSRGRCVAELQVAGVKVTFTKMMARMSITLTVHSLLLVDALQTFGADFELLIASHKHVGMDSMSGSLRDSEPTSPVSPASPDATTTKVCVTSPVALSQALTTLASSPLHWPAVQATPTFPDAEALISIEVVYSQTPTPVQKANILVNNLDIIANQETIVELMGFIRRVFPKSHKSTGINLASSMISTESRASTESLLDDNSSKLTSTELTFHFHRLNVLLLRGIIKNGMLYGRKICTATMSEAKVKAFVDNKLEVQGSLGGLQVLDLTPEGYMHQRIISVGQDPLFDAPHPIYMMSVPIDNKTAFSFKIVRNLESSLENDSALISIRMASLWYTHSPHFVNELQSCATEFKQYLSNLAKSIKSAATDMALGLVHARAEALAQSLYMNSRLSSSIYGNSILFPESASPRRRRYSSSTEQSAYCSAKETIPQTPYSPVDDDGFIINIELNIELETPVVVLPRASNSTQVFVAHLGKIKIGNKLMSKSSNSSPNGNCLDDTKFERYEVEVRDMNLYSLETFSRRVPGPMICKPEALYNCETIAKPILHDTVLYLTIDRHRALPKVNESLIMEDEDQYYLNGEMLEISGIIRELKVSLTRGQYEQLLDTIQLLTTTSTELQSGYNRIKTTTGLKDISEEDTGVTTLNMVPHVRAKLFPPINNLKNKPPLTNNLSWKVSFELPIFTIELLGDSGVGEKALVDLSFRDFIFNYEKFHKFETNIKVSLRSILMEDLLQAVGSKQRSMVVSSSSSDAVPMGGVCVSRSCPDVTLHQNLPSPVCGSLPDFLETSKVFGGSGLNNIPAYPSTPPPSPSQGSFSSHSRPEKNLVLISTLLVDPAAPNFATAYDSVQRSTRIDFNCLDLVVSVQSWVVVIDFFSASPTQLELSKASLNSLLSDDSRGESEVNNTETTITVRSLTLVLVKPELDIAKANISYVDVLVKTCGLQKEVEGKLGTMSLLDLTLQGQLYRERFQTTGKQALQFKYVRHSPETSEKDYDAQLKLDMSSVMYVHTKRFVVEMQAFFKHFSQLQAVMRGIRAATSGQLIRDAEEPLRLSLILQAGSPLILLPVCSKSSDVLVVDLGQLLVTNTFHFSGDEDTISIVTPDKNKPCLLDVMVIELENMDLYAGVKESDLKPVKKDSFILGCSRIMKKGPSLLSKKFRLRIQVERNLYSPFNHAVPDMSIYGQLSTLDGTLDLDQYQLIRGLLTYNLGEDTERILPSVSPRETNSGKVENFWTLSSLKLDLQNVSLKLVENHGEAPLACINFIKSRLIVESFSNLSQDIDLVSQEILIMDTRQTTNVYTNILQPSTSASNQSNDLVLAEIHSRKRHDHTKFTILLNNMRLMAIFDWWMAIKEYIFQEIGENVVSSPRHQVASNKNTNETFELKLNITDCELVLIEDSHQIDSNAVILKSTTVVTYNPKNIEKPLSLNLNNCEMFSCILGMESDTALSIIDPVTLNMDINKDNVLELQLHLLTVRLSYHDMRMFMQMMNSLPKQLFATRKMSEAAVIKTKIAPLVALGFSTNDCRIALEQCQNQLDDAALWLTHNAKHDQPVSKPDKSLVVSALEIKADCISVCIIDDCGDSDVPLLELSFSDLVLLQLLPEIKLNTEIQTEGYLKCILASDYYNRVLSGWEPILEPWPCKISWDKDLSATLQKNRLNVKINSVDCLNVNVTSTLMDLYKQVKENWLKDYYNVKENQNKQLASPGYRRRSPFVPFALKNDTGSPLYFTTLISDIDRKMEALDDLPDEKWTLVEPSEIVPFAFSSRDKIRHQDSHKLKLHQLGVKVDGWRPVQPVTVDQVGVFFRYATVQIQHRSQREIPPARIVFDISLEGSARKLITVRSALTIHNKLPHTIEIKLESQLPHDVVTLWVASKTFIVRPDTALAVPLVHAFSQIAVRPSQFVVPFTFSTPTISWQQMPANSDVMYELRTCHTHRGQNYRFCAEIAREKHVLERSMMHQPAHRINILPTVKMVNLLPVDLDFNLCGFMGRIPAGESSDVAEADPDKELELNIILENFCASTALRIPSNSTSASLVIHIEDNIGRKLYLNAVVVPNRGAKLKISISAPYWIINRTGLPLVFRQAGVPSECAGQFEEHEVARIVAPLLFSFSDQDASPTIDARVGNRVSKDGVPQWCTNFHVHEGTLVRKLVISMRDGRPDTVFVVGLQVRLGRGKYRTTHIITISPRYQLHNRSSYQLIFTQCYFAKIMPDPKSHKQCIRALPNSHMPFHWLTQEKEQLLCVSIQDVPECCWSGGLPIDANNSMHVNIRDINGRVYFLRLEVVLQSATVYIVFTDADTMPPPMRIDNFSEVSITFGQSCCKETTHSTARAHSSVPYAWDHPTKPYLINLLAPGGVSHTYDTTKLGKGPGLTYENFIYIAFEATFKNSQDVLDPLNIESQQLVLDVVNNHVVLSRKFAAQRSQLWRMTSEGRLQHEGSSPPSHPSQSRNENILVLDIDNTAPQPNVYSRLILRRLDPRRTSTQTWRFTDGRLYCAHHNMCVQAQDGFFGIRQGNAAVLGMPQPVCYQLTENGVPVEQAITWQRLRPGSGSLTVEILMDGPTRVISIKDLKEKRIYATPDDREWGRISINQRPRLHRARTPIDDDDVENEEEEKGELQVYVNLQELGISLVCRRTPEELLYVVFTNIVCEITKTPASKRFCISVGNVQVDNQLFDASVPVVLYVTPPKGIKGDEQVYNLPAIDFSAELQQQLNENAVIFKYLLLSLTKITIVIEELLLLKLIAFFGFHSEEEELLNKDENDYETQQLLTQFSTAHSKRYYFGVINLIPAEIRISVKTASKVPSRLIRIRRKLGLRLFKFEDAAVDLQAFKRQHPFESSQFLIKAILKHFKDELVWQAGIIIGSVDFIGNPLGLVNDVSEGFSGLFYEGNVGALVKNVTHGLSNSAAKVTESLSDGLGRVAMDDYHEEIRQKIRQVEGGSSKDHIVAGFKGLGFGLLGGATGIFKQVYEGAASDGLPGVFSGLGKGLVGAVTKPVVGMLDFASETARAVRDSSRSKLIPERHRLPRCVNGPGGLLPRYNLKQSQGQQYLYILNDKTYDEQLVAYQILGSASEDLPCIISNRTIRIVANTSMPDLTPVIDCHLSNLESCGVIMEKDKNSSDHRYYIEIVMHASGTSSALVNPDPVRKPRVRCRNLDLAKTVAQQINYAKRLYYERQFSLVNDNTSNNED